jgi:predicted nucleotidyltransferase
MTIAAGSELPEAEIADICRHQIRELSVFGSAARGEMRPDSDIDFLVDFLPGSRPGLLGVAAMIRELTTLLGRRVDVAVKPALTPTIRPGVLSEARLVYAA